MRPHLKDGDRVCIVGAGPAGSFAALHLLHLADRAGLSLEVLLFEPRDFSAPGPGGCNRCAGVLSTRLLRGMQALGLDLPPQVVQTPIRSYAIHLDGDLVSIGQPDPQRRIVSVYRGGGPRLAPGGGVAGFDAFLLEQAVARGARHIPVRVRKVDLDARPVVHTARASYAADLLVLATGVNSRAPLDRAFAYHAPPTEVMAQDEILRPPDWPPDQVSAFFRHPPGLTFGALIPKGRYLNISLLGRRLSTDAVADFLEAQGLAPGLPPAPGSLCGCTPRIAVGAAGCFFGERWVAVGDAAVTRLYKDGIGSAFHTARRAMQGVLEHGLSQRGFQRAYAPYCRAIQRDNLYGRLLFTCWEWTLRSPLLLRAWKLALQAEQAEPPERRVHIRVLWGMFTGDELYRNLFWLSVSPRALRGLARGLRGSPRKVVAR